MLTAFLRWYRSGGSQESFPFLGGHDGVFRHVSRAQRGKARSLREAHQAHCDLIIGGLDSVLLLGGHHVLL
ncbi:hypothetical protein PMAYCL1PPCAC_09225, partial [Pristionchus mayeri]